MLVSVTSNGIRNVKFFITLFISFYFAAHSHTLVTHIKSMRYLRLQIAVNMTVLFGVQKIRRGK